MVGVSLTISYNVELPTIQVGLDRMYSDHLPLSVTIPCTVNAYPSKRKPKLVSDCKKVSALYSDKSATKSSEKLRFHFICSGGILTHLIVK
jgi:hypothetical protein